MKSLSGEQLALIQNINVVVVVVVTYSLQCFSLWRKLKQEWLVFFFMIAMKMFIKINEPHFSLGI